MAVTYDASGNPTSYLGKALTWNGRQLVGYGSHFSFDYDENGLRTSKTVSGVTTEYYYNGSLLMGVKRGSDTLLFSYDAAGSVVSVNFNGTEYYYLKNAQSDIIAIVDSNGAVMVSYYYDAWGKPTTAGSMSSTLGAYNPFRYRSYIYDTETGFYYLQSRYYDPSYGRFISPDILVSTGQGIIGNNMFAYCGNNPVTRADTSGLFWDTVFDVVSLCFSIAEVVENPDDAMAWLSVAADVASLVLPGVTGGGSIVKAVSKADNIVDAAKAIENVGDVKSVATMITKGEGVFRDTFRSLKRKLGFPGMGKQWHHIVEQCQMKLTRSGFDKHWIQNALNTIKVDNKTHVLISSFYSSIPDQDLYNTGGQVFRDWLSSESFEEQYEIGVKLIEYFGVDL